MSTTIRSQSTNIALTETHLPETPTLKFVSRGKVRDLYEITDNGEGGDAKVKESYLLFIATDRISAFDVVLRNGVPNKGRLLTLISTFWFSHLSTIIQNHVVASSLQTMPPSIRRQLEPIWYAHDLEGRTLLVRKCKVVKLEAIVRGYLTGSAWSEYKQHGTVHGIKLREGYLESDKLDEPLFTPSTKADQGEHDENISPERAKDIIGPALYDAVSKTSLSLFASASTYARSKGLILADTKFEFGLLPLDSTGSLGSKGDDSSKAPPVILNLPPSTTLSPTEAQPATTPYLLLLIDEALTPDSSRYWSLASYAPSKPQPSFDKQYLRDWLKQSGFRKGRESEEWVMSEEVVKGTKERYEEVIRILGVLDG